MSEEEKENLTPEEKEALQHFEGGMRKTINGFLSPIYSVLDWCIPATIFGLVIRFIANHTGWNGIVPLWLATIFIWGPLALSLAFCGLVIVGFYIFSLFCVWHKFCVGVVEYFKAGYDKSQEENDDKGEQ